MSNEVKPNIADFIDGERDADDGVQADTDRSEDYQSGYNFKYQIIEIQSKEFDHGLA